MGIGARHWSPDGRYQEMACKHWSNATNMIIDRITSGGAYTDPVLGTVVTMAFGERLSGNEAAWHIHVDGLAQLIRERRLRDGTDLPQWFYDVSILDSTNALLNFPRTYHPKVVEEVVKYGRRSFCDVADICNNLLELREQMKTCDDECSGVVATNQDFGPFTYRILGQAWALRSSYASPSIHITSLTVELVLHLIWPRQPETDVTPLAKQLQEALMSLPVRPCSYMDLTSRQLMIGAIVARPGSETRMWFVEKIRKAVVQLKSRGWEDPLEIIRKGSADIPRLSPYIKNLLDELSS
ncbi:hypothetical protein F4778DRAFT_734282 [Xylariomycetidae sp. FL2044]|nr:hypothetical protein F4778DRAFT_734282 [Xylariomycetidae sp. FL2044]